MEIKAQGPKREKRTTTMPYLKNPTKTFLHRYAINYLYIVATSYVAGTLITGRDGGCINGNQFCQGYS